MADDTEINGWPWTRLSDPATPDAVLVSWTWDDDRSGDAVLWLDPSPADVARIRAALPTRAPWPDARHWLTSLVPGTAEVPCEW